MPTSRIIPLNVLEDDAKRNILVDVSPLLEVSEWLFQAIQLLPAILKQKSLNNGLVVQFGLLKQILSCLRGTELLLQIGYTNQAAAVACSAFELALYSKYIRDDIARVELFLRHDNPREFVWRPREIMRELASLAKDIDDNGAPIAFEQRFDMISLPYVYLSSLKHGNPIGFRRGVTARPGPAVLHPESPHFGVVPDARASDLSQKIVVFAIALGCAFESVSQVIAVSNVKSADLISWQEARNLWHGRLNERLLALEAKSGPLPFSVVRNAPKAG
jgi:hypothetical protein